MIRYIRIGTSLGTPQNTALVEAQKLHIFQLSLRINRMLSIPTWNDFFFFFGGKISREGAFGLKFCVYWYIYLYNIDDNLLFLYFWYS